MRRSHPVSSSFDAKCRFWHRGIATLIFFVLFISGVGFAQEKTDGNQETNKPKPEATNKSKPPRKSTGFYSPLKKKPKATVDKAAEKPAGEKAVQPNILDRPGEFKLGGKLPVDLMDKAPPRGMIPPKDEPGQPNDKIPPNEEDGNDANLPVKRLLLPDSPEAKAALNVLPRAARTQLENQIYPALEAGNYVQFIGAMDAFVTKQKPETVEAVDDFCASIGIGTLKRHLADVFSRSVEQGLPIRRDGMSPAFIEYVTSGVVDAVNLELAEFGDHPIMQDPLTLPVDWRDSEQLFWEVHVWKNRFNNLNQMVLGALALQQPILDRATRDKDQLTIDRLQARASMTLSVRETYRELREREAELRIEELAKAEEVLRLKPDFESELNAAFVLEMHGGALEQFFTEFAIEDLQRERFLAPEIKSECLELLASGRKHGKDVLEKAVLLRAGAHWWLRGRYGVATMASGLLKPPAAMKSKDVMFGLFMPKQRPQAIGYVDLESGKESSGYDRRHYYTWAVERRDVGVERYASRFGEKESSIRVTGKNASHFW